VVLFKGAVSHELIDDYLRDIAAFISEYKSFEIPIEIRGKQISSRDLQAFPGDLVGVKLNHMHSFSRAAAQLSLTPNVTRFLSHLFGGPASVCQSLTFWRGSQQTIHIDFPYVKQQTKLSYLAASWIALEDVHPDAGPFAYYPGGHKIEKSGFFDWGGGSIVPHAGSDRTPTQFSEYLAARMKAIGIERQVLCPQRGDVLIWHGNLPHEGTRVNNPSLTRKSYVTHYTAEATVPDWMRNIDEQGRPIGVFEGDGYSYRFPWFNGKKMLPSWTRHA
jgi:phytanoyl-CoA hydroxylase